LKGIDPGISVDTITMAKDIAFAVASLLSKLESYSHTV